MAKPEDNDGVAGALTDERLYGLIEIAERQQNVAQIALEGMVKERIALGEGLGHFSDTVTDLQGRIQSMVEDAILETRNNAEDTGALVVHGAMDSLKVILQDVAEQAGQTEATLRAVAQWLSWRALWLGLATVVALAVLWRLAGCAVLWWDTSAIGRAEIQKVRLQTEIERLEENQKVWVSAGMESKLSHCGRKMRPCVKVDESAGAFGENGEYRMIGHK